LLSVGRKTLRLVMSKPKPSLKIRTASAIFWDYLGTAKKFFLGIFFFVFQYRKLKLSASVWKWILWNLTKFQLIQTIVTYIFSLCCLIELKFCEVSRNSFLNRCWKFQPSILKNEKVLFLKVLVWTFTRQTRIQILSLPESFFIFLPKFNSLIYSRCHSCPQICKNIGFW
jgi:hypothetical protein